LKLAYYALGFFIVGSVTIALSLPLTSSRMGKPKVASDKTIVYVDTDRLMRLHPSADALAVMRQIAADVRLGMRTMPFSANRDLPQKTAVPVASDGITCSVSRDKLEADVARAAIGALRDLESAQREVLKARLRATRRMMEESANADIRSRVQDIEQETSRKLRDVAERYAADRINASLKIGALRVADKSLKSLVERSGGIAAKGQSAPDSPAAINESAEINSKLRDAQAELARIVDVGAEEDARIKADMRAKIEALWSDSAANIEKSLSAIERDANARIERDIMTAQNDIIQELSSLGKWFNAGDSAKKTTGYARTAANPVQGSAFIIQQRRLNPDSVDTAVAALEQRIRLDIRRAVRLLADKQGIDVTFVRHGDGLPDRTREFEKKLRCLFWNECGPVLCDVKG